MFKIMPESIFYDWEYKILLSKTCNVYSNELKINSIYWYDFIFEFEKNNEMPNNSWMQIIPNDEDKKIIIKLTNFTNPLWTWTTERVMILSLTPEDWVTEKEVFFSVYAKSLTETTSFLQVTITFYAR